MALLKQLEEQNEGTRARDSSGHKEPQDPTQALQSSFGNRGLSLGSAHIYWALVQNKVLFEILHDAMLEYS